MFSRVGFSAGPGAREMSVWHLRVTAGNPPAANYLPLSRFERPSAATFKAQIDFLEQYAALRPDRAFEILAQMDTNIAFLSSIAYLHPERSRWTLELLDAAFRLARFVEMRVKHALACRRPIEFSPQVQPMILTPAHGTLPSGHATEAFTMALVLWRLLVAGANPAYGHVSYGVQLMRQAARIAINRTAGGVHVPADSIAGAVLGLTLGQYLVNRASGVNTYHASGFDGVALDGLPNPGVEDFDWTDLFDETAAPPAIKYVKAYVTNLAAQNMAGDTQPSALIWLWNKAVAEWA
jgi:membrane-associated phospholipid phosphatase